MTAARAAGGAIGTVTEPPACDARLTDGIPGLRDTVSGQVQGMTLSGIPVADPYFAAVRREPAAEPSPAGTDATTAAVVADDVDEVVAAVLARVGFFTAELWSSVEPTTELDPQMSLAPAERASDVRVEAHVADAGSDEAALGRLRSALEQRGWDVTGDRELEAHLAGGTVTASYADAGLRLTVDSAPVPVGQERAAALVRDGMVA